MYDSNYAQIWIENHKSGKDQFRKQYLEPYFKITLGGINSEKKVLDVGCGWGSALDFLNSKIQYFGIDITLDFFDYIKKTYTKRNINLSYGGLPENINFEKNSFDVCICSQVLHTQKNLELSVNTLFSKIKHEGKLIIITFNNASKEPLIKSYNPIEKLDKYHVVGDAILPSGLKVHSEVYFHKEEDYEKEILKYGKFKKNILGPLFVAYYCEKTK